MSLKAIQTRYAGYLFRSRLEARWAVFFDALKLDWQYEPEGFELKSGKYYLPDFRINLGERGTLWVEVKPEGGDSSLLVEFMGGIPYRNMGIVLHDIPDPRKSYQGSDVWFGNNGDTDEPGGWDSPYEFCVCHRCQKAGFEFSSYVERIMCGCSDPVPDNQKIVSAFAKARAARFEHEDREVYAI